MNKRQFWFGLVRTLYLLSNYLSIFIYQINIYVSIYPSIYLSIYMAGDPACPNDRQQRGQRGAAAGQTQGEAAVCSQVVD